MRYLCLLVLLSASIAHAAPFNDLSREQMGALGQLFAGYSESFLCRKPVDFDVAGTFINEKLESKPITPKRSAELAHMAIGIQILVAERLQKKLPANANERGAMIKAHCVEVEKHFGAHGDLIKGLLK